MASSRITCLNSSHVAIKRRLASTDLRMPSVRQKTDLGGFVTISKNWWRVENQVTGGIKWLNTRDGCNTETSGLPWIFQWYWQRSCRCRLSHHGWYQVWFNMGSISTITAPVHWIDGLQLHASNVIYNYVNLHKYCGRKRQNAKMLKYFHHLPTFTVITSWILHRCVK